jgi:DNA mismatch repair protein MutL
MFEPVIAVLPAHVIDQIAAGEVIERPASVVKELVDNAIDAGARTIVIETAGGGRNLVRVSDDGCGMSPRDAVLAFERHATSKLRQVDDLWALTSMGFRGEALPAIASVARVVLTTRREADVAATRVCIEAGKLVSVTELGAAVGTTVEVVDLLWNLPARLKFLKGEATEASHVTDLVAKVAMAHPALHLRLRHNGRTALELPPDRDGFARAQALLGSRIASRMIPVSGEEAGVRVTAYLGAPELAQATSRGVQIFVGRRQVRDRGVLHAVTMGYGELVPRGRYPVAVVLLDVPPGAVDINVHPQKLEVRFADATAVAAAVRHVVQTGVGAAPWRGEAAGPIQMTAIASSAPPALPFDGQPATALAQRYARELRARSGQASLGFDGPRGWVAQVHQQSRAAEGRVAASYARARRESGIGARGSDRFGSEGAGLDGDFGGAGAGSSHPGFDRSGSGQSPAILLGADRADSNRADSSRLGADRADSDGVGLDRPGSEHPGVDRPDSGRFGSDGAAADTGRFAEGSGPVTHHGYFSRLRYLGQLDLTYLVCEAESELVLVDQHAAHERIELARLQARRTECEAAVQKLLFPVTIEATPAQLELVARVGPLLAQVGFEAEAFGKATLAIKAVPAGIRHGDPAQLLRRLLDEWARDGAPSDEERLARVLAEIACHSVVRAGDRLGAGEAESLLRSLDNVDLDAPAPHGRALLLRLPLSEIGRRFGR